MRTPAARTLALALAPALALSAAQCGSSESKPDVVVEPGQLIQDAINQMPKEATSWIVEIKPGVYTETIAVDRSGVELRGVVTGPGPGDRAVLDGKKPDGKLLKDAVIVSGSHFYAHGLTVRNYSGNGITTMKSRDVKLVDLYMDSTGRYGLYPVESEDILVENCVSTNIADAGIYVGQSKRATVRNNRVFGNVSGIEIENTDDSIVENNDVTNNATGILAFVLPNNVRKEGKNNVIRNNKVYANNHDNFGDPMAIVSRLPSGGGILIMAADGTLVTGNEIRDNRTMGAAIISLPSKLFGDMVIDVEPNSDTTKFQNNTYSGNGKNADPKLKDYGVDKGGDMLFDGTGKNNCWDEPQESELVSPGIALQRCR